MFKFRKKETKVLTPEKAYGADVLNSMNGSTQLALASGSIVALGGVSVMGTGYVMETASTTSANVPLAAAGQNVANVGLAVMGLGTVAISSAVLTLDEKTYDLPLSKRRAAKYEGVERQETLKSLSDNSSKLMIKDTEKKKDNKNVLKFSI